MAFAGPSPRVDEAPGEPRPAAAPPLVAVVVTRDPGPWFPEVVDCLAAQDYPNLSVLVIDAGSSDDPTPAVARALPSAYVRRLDRNPGYGTAANEVLEVVEGAAFFAFLHDDVALAPDALRLLVEEAFRSNAGIVGPKLVNWDRPRELLQVGMGADKTGVPAPYVERGELDQEQHDAVRDVFFVPGACTLVRADLFAELGGFDEAIEFLGEDLDLCWRAHVAGARVVVAPGARGRHVEALGLRRPVDDRRKLAARHRLRSALKCYSPLSLLRVLPQAVLFALVEIVYALVVGRGRQAQDVASAWPWNLRRLGTVFESRRRIRKFRRVRDSEVRRFQARGSARLVGFLRGQLGGGEERLRSVTAASREFAGSLRTGHRRVAITIWTLLVVVLVAGSRTLVTDGVPAVGQFGRFPGGPSDLLGEFVSGWRSAGLGSEAPAPTAFGLLGLAGVAFVGAMGFLRLVLVVGMLPLGLLGAWRLAGELRSPRARLVAVVLYASLPLPYNAIAEGRWDGVALYAAIPWVLARLMRATGLPPTDEEATRPLRPQILALGLLLAVVAALVPFVPVVALLVAAGIVLGSLVVGDVTAATRSAVAAAGAGLVAVVLHVPWTFDFLLPGSRWSSFGGVAVAEGGGRSVLELLRFETGPLGAGPLGFALLVAAALPLLIGGGWRFAWAVRAWAVALLSLAAALAAERGWLPVGLPSTEVLLAPAGIALALSGALGMAAFETDLPGYRFGWRQVASLAAGAALLVGVGPLLVGAVDGRWDAPGGDFASTLGFMDEEAEEEGSFRVLWAGDPRVLPLAGWELTDGLAYATSDDGAPDVADQWAGSDDGSTGLVADALRLAADGQTGRLGRLLAPMGVRYLVVPERAAPARYRTPRSRPPSGLVESLGSQLDLRRVDLEEALLVYENTAWVPVRAELGDEAAERSGEAGLQVVAGTDFGGSEAVLRNELSYAAWDGDVRDGATVYLGAAASDGWRLSVDGEAAERTKAFGWANRFAVDDDGEGTLSFRTSPLRYGMLAVQALLWLLVVRAVVGARRRRRAAA